MGKSSWINNQGSEPRKTWYRSDFCPASLQLRAIDVSHFMMIIYFMNKRSITHHITPMLRSPIMITHGSLTSLLYDTFCVFLLRMGF
jgi:hypothetical protein